MLHFFLPAAGFFSRSRLRGTQGGRLYTTAQVWVPTGFLGACSGRSKSPNLASNRGIAFRPARAHQTHANPEKRHFFFIFSPLFAAIFDVHSSCQRLGSHRTTVALSAFPFVTAIFIFSMLPAAAVPVLHRKLLTLWQLRYSSSSRTSRSSFSDSYERRFCVCVCAYYVGAPS